MKRHLEAIGVVVVFEYAAVFLAGPRLGILAILVHKLYTVLLDLDEGNLLYTDGNQQDTTDIKG